MFRRDLITLIWCAVPIILFVCGMYRVETIEELCLWLTSDIVVIVLLVLPEVIKPNGKFAAWLTKRIF